MLKFVKMIVPYGPLHTGVFYRVVETGIDWVLLSNGVYVPLSFVYFQNPLV